MLRNLRPALNRPPDFKSFWKQTQRELDEVPVSVSMQRTRQSESPDVHLEEVTFLSLGKKRIHGYLLRWDDQKRRPLVVHSHGYNSECVPQWSWAHAGMNVFGVDIRGFGKSRSAVPVPSRWGYMLTGMQSPETHVLRGAICDYLKAVRLATAILKDQVERTIFHGTSFAGALALMAAATLPTADLLVIAVPTFGWAEGRHFFVKSGSGSEISQFLAQRPEYAEDLMVVLRYFDSMNFAGQVRCPTLVGVGMADDVVPPQTVYAIANHLGGPHEIMEFPVSHSNAAEEEEWQKFERRWLRLATEGVPPGFGKRESVSPSS